MGVSGQRHAPAALLPPGKGPPVPIIQEAGLAPRAGLDTEEKSFDPAGDRTPVVQPVVRHYTAWANRLPSCTCTPINYIIYLIFLLDNFHLVVIPSLTKVSKFHDWRNKELAFKLSVSYTIIF
jgi:hypothetical protein